MFAKLMDISASAVEARKDDFEIIGLFEDGFGEFMLRIEV